MLLQVMAQRIELWSLDRLVPYTKNPRTHSDAQVAQIAASIAEFGFNNPILVDTKAGIIAGHGRLLAARKLRLKEVPVIILDHCIRSIQELVSLGIASWLRRRISIPTKATRPRNSSRTSSRRSPNWKER
jgi:hypothetical protein